MHKVLATYDKNSDRYGEKQQQKTPVGFPHMIYLNRMHPIKGDHRASLQMLQIYTVQKFGTLSSMNAT